MVIPAPIKELDEPDSLFSKPTGKQAIVAQAGSSDLRSVCIEGRLGFLGNIHHLRNRSLHPVSQFILGDPGEGLRVSELLGRPMVQVLKRIEAGPTQPAVHARRIGNI